MLKVLSVHALTTYRDRIKHYHDTFGGAKTWAQFYQADVHARLEHVERVRRRRQEWAQDFPSQAQDVEDTQMPRHYNRKNPRERCFRELAPAEATLALIGAAERAQLHLADARAILRRAEATSAHTRNMMEAALIQSRAAASLRHAPAKPKSTM